MEIEVKDNPAKNRFETTIDGHTAVIDYKLKPGVMTVLHTEVPKEVEGRGIAGTLTRYALKHIEANQLELVPLCPYMRSYLKKHPEYQYLVRKESDKNA
ncbi:GNAT family N-acetyltransferase [Pontibacter sp. BT731]|uniref:GNAT family N-acetyltransferase n=1 Tax=Pontibacter coccineus TaxID=3063328 RepID=UPI0026E410E3|nr:GNAT family N-acetyltransferase [Pontibacter sp. BT731]MDO6388614.1 GNAT family N-acetyltransferase [Pontibacter sp. BT731]